MGAEWTVISRGDHDVEEVASPRTLVSVCPSCGSRARLVERELVRNLKLLGVALLATERGGRVFQCSQCEGLCVREGDDLPLGLSARLPDDDRAEELTERVLKAEDEAVTWARRAEVADERGDAALAAEMREQAAKSSRAAKLLRRELAAATGAPLGHSAAEETAQGVAVGAAADANGAVGSSEAPAAQAPSIDDELSALRARVAEKKRPAAPAPTPADDELASLKAKLARGSAAPEPVVEAPAAPVDEGAGSEPEPPAEEGGDEGDEFAAMKRRLRKKK